MSHGPRVEMRRYLRSWIEWARKLSDDDLRQVISFLQTVRHAHYVGQQRADESPEKPPEEHYSGVTGDPVRPKLVDESEHNGQPILTEEKPDGPAH